MIAGFTGEQAISKGFNREEELAKLLAGYGQGFQGPPAPPTISPAVRDAVSSGGMARRPLRPGIAEAAKRLANGPATRPIEAGEPVRATPTREPGMTQLKAPGPSPVTAASDLAATDPAFPGEDESLPPPTARTAPVSAASRRMTDVLREGQAESPVEPFKLSAEHEKQGTALDRLRATKGLADVLGGLKFYAGMGRSGRVQEIGGEPRTKALGEAIQSKQREREKATLTPYQAGQLDVANRRTDADLAISGAEAQRKAEYAKYAKERDARADLAMSRVPPEDARTLDQLRDADEKMTKIMQRVKAGRGPNATESEIKFGPIEGRLQQAGRFFGLGDPETLRVASDLASAINSYIYASTGKQLNEQEMKRLTSELPQMWDKPETFDKLVEAYLERNSAARGARMQRFREQGYDVSPWEKPVAGATAGGGMIEVEVPGMGTDTIHESQWESVLKKYPNARKVR